MVALRAQGGIGARALEFRILSAGRAGEIIGATWPEVDFEAKVWAVPGSRMKASKDHKVPLSPRAIEILREMVEADQKRLREEEAAERRQAGLPVYGG